MPPLHLALALVLVWCWRCVGDGVLTLIVAAVNAGVDADVGVDRGRC